MTLELHEAEQAPGIWAGQWIHFVSLSLLLLLLALTWFLIGKPLPHLFWTAALIPVLHQIFVWLAWRYELNDSTLSQTIGFQGYLVMFFILFVGSFVSLALLGWFDKGSLQLSTVTQAVGAIAFALPGLYAMYSVHRYFGIARAAGADHFDEKYRQMPPVREGIFKYSNNGMYAFAFLLFWAIAIALNSLSALAVAVFSHAYIWVHYHATEKPDMAFIYGSESK